MGKTKIIAAIAFVVLIVVILAGSLTLYFVFRNKGPFSGRVTDKETGEGIEGVMVTDGRHVVKTDADGKFYLEGYNKSRFVTVTVPSGYNADAFYIPVKSGTKSYDFSLTKIDADYSGGHSFLQISDTEIGKNGAGEWLDHVKKLVDELDPSFLVHTGDICYEDGLKQHIVDMNSENMGLPVRYVIGNHDYVKWGWYGEALYESLYGPVWYSFDVGNVHYIVTPFQVGADRPSGYDKDDRWKWLANDLAAVDPDMKIVMFNHTTPPSDDYVIKYKDDGDKSIDLVQNDLIAWVFGHYHENYVEKNGSVLNISTGRPDCGGIDSSPSGTRHIKIDEYGNIETKMYYYDFDGASASPAQAIWSNEELKGNVLFCDTLLSGNTVFVGTSDDDYPRECGVYAVDAASGVTKWFFRTENSVKNDLVYHDGKILAQDAAGNVYCINSESGEQIWTQQVGLGNQYCTSTGIVADDGRLYVGNAAQITAFDISNGIAIWLYDRAYGENSPARFVIAGRLLLVNSHWDALVALDKYTGAKVWEIKDEDIRFRSSTPALIDEYTAIVADDDAVMIVDLKKGSITAKRQWLDSEGNSLYKFNTSSQPYVSGGTAYIATANKGIIAFDIATREIKWNVETGKSLVYTAPYSGGDSATVESSFAVKDGCLIFGANDGFLYKVSMADGSVVDKIDVGAPIFGKVALTEDGNVIVVDFAGRMFKLSI